MKFKLTVEINCDTDVFQPSPEREVKRILRDVARRVFWEDREQPLDITVKLYDINGHHVGEATSHTT